MAAVQPADIIQPEYFAEYRANSSMVSTALFKSKRAAPPSSVSASGRSPLRECSSEAERTG